MVIDMIIAFVTAFFAASSGQTAITPKMAEFDLEKVHHKDAIARTETRQMK